MIIFYLHLLFEAKYLIKYYRCMCCIHKHVIDVNSACMLITLLVLIMRWWAVQVNNIIASSNVLKNEIKL